MKLKLLLICILFPALVFSQGISRGAASLKLPLTPFVGATGESFIADPISLQSIRVNPANIASSDAYNVIFSHTEFIQDIRTDFLSLSAPFRYGTLAFSVTNASVDGLEYRTIPGPAIGNFNTQSASFQLTYGVQLTDDISFGISPKYLYEKIFVDEATGWGLDLGALYKLPVDGLTLGCALTNLGVLSAFRTEQTDLPTQIRIGGTYVFSSFEQFTFRTAAAFSSELGVNVTHFHIGGEARYKDIVCVRLGYKTGYEYQGFSAGVGVRYNFVIIDYAFIPSSSNLGKAHSISIGFVF
jgi:hypothetical protein